MFTCPECNAKNEKDAGFCCKCGINLERNLISGEEVYKEKCPECNTDNEKDAKFCCKCGLILIIEDSPSELQPLSPGTILSGRYKIIREVKRGGMGCIYEAKHISLEKIYAVKELLNISMDSRNRLEAIKRFEQEGKILSELSHPNLPSVSDFFFLNGRYYLVMDFIKGKDLSCLLKDDYPDGIPEEDVMEWALQICEILEYLHGRNPPVIYRDIKPANIMIRESDRKAVLVDFGIARKLFEEDLSRTKTTIGTVGYSSPEQYEGKPVPQSDLYSLGATMYQLITGKKSVPFTFPPLINKKPDISEKTNAVVMTALRHNLGERFQSATEMKQAISGMIEIKTPQIDIKDKIDVMLLQLESSEKQVKKYFIETLRETKNTRIIPPMLKVLKMDPDPEIRTGALKSLIQFKGEEKIELALKSVLLEDKSALVRVKAVQFMPEYDEKAFIEPLIKSLDDSAEEVRMMAIVSLGKLKAEKALDRLWKIFREEKGLIREDALNAIEKISPETIKKRERENLQKREKLQKKKNLIALISIGFLFIIGLLVFKYLFLRINEQKINTFLSAGFNHLDNNRKEEARKEFEQARLLLEKSPSVKKKAELFYGTGLTYYQENRAKSIENFEKAITLDKDLPEPYLYLGYTYLREKNYTKALEYLEKAKELMPDEENIYLALKDIYYRTDEREKADAIVREYSAKFPGNPDKNINAERLNSKGIDSLNEKKYMEAIDYFTQSLQIDRENPDTSYYLGIAYLKIDKNQAEYYLKKTLDYSPGYIEALISLAQLKYDLKNYNETIALCKKGIEINPKTGRFYILMGISCYNVGQKNEALAALNKYLELEPDGKYANIATSIIEEINSP